MELIVAQENKERERVENSKDDFPRIATPGRLKVSLQLEDRYPGGMHVRVQVLQAGKQYHAEDVSAARETPWQMGP